MNRAGFTLLESLVVIAIISILVTIGIYSYAQATRSGRDARRKSDIAAIEVGFVARYQTRNCSTDAQVGKFPGVTKIGGRQEFDPSKSWQNIGSLSTYTDQCGAFAEFLRTIPTDPRYNNTRSYKYALSPSGNHYRLAAILEGFSGGPQSANWKALYETENRTWKRLFVNQSGQVPGYEQAVVTTGSTTSYYNYFIGR